MNDRWNRFYPAAGCFYQRFVLFICRFVIEFSFSSAVAKEKLAKETTKFPRWPERDESKVSAPATCTSLFPDEKLKEWLHTFHFVSMAPSTINFRGRVRHWSTEYISLSISNFVRQLFPWEKWQQLLGFPTQIWLIHLAEFKLVLYRSIANSKLYQLSFKSNSTWSSVWWRISQNDRYLYLTNSSIKVFLKLNISRSCLIEFDWNTHHSIALDAIYNIAFESKSISWNVIPQTRGNRQDSANSSFSYSRFSWKYGQTVDQIDLNLKDFR